MNSQLFPPTDSSSEKTPPASIKAEKTPPVFAKKAFIEWFIGFVEGDGCFSISRRISRNQNEFSLTISQKESQVLQLIQEKCGHGRLYRRKTGYYELRFATQQSILFLIKIFDGNLRLVTRQDDFSRWASMFLEEIPKRRLGIPLEKDDQERLPRLKRLALENEISVLHDSLPERTKTSNLSETSKDHAIKTRGVSPRNFIPIDLKTAWLSGFMQAEGCFIAQFYIKPERPLGYQLILRIQFTQNAAVAPFSQLQQVIGSGSVQSTPTSTRLTFTSEEALQQLVDYFHRFPLYGRKHIAQSRWMRLYRFRQAQKPLPKYGTLAYRRVIRMMTSVNATQKS